MTRKPSEIPTHESALRRMQADARGGSYKAFRSLEEAQRDQDAVVILEGDYGGQIYLVAPANAVRCSEQTLAQLLSDIDASKWNDADGARVYYERRAVGEGISGGMGGGLVADGVWIHKDLRALANEIAGVLEGHRERISPHAG